MLNNLYCEAVSKVVSLGKGLLIGLFLVSAPFAMEEMSEDETAELAHQSSTQLLVTDHPPSCCYGCLPKTVGFMTFKKDEQEDPYKLPAGACIECLQCCTGSVSVLEAIFVGSCSQAIPSTIGIGLGIQIGCCALPALGCVTAHGIYKCATSCHKKNFIKEADEARSQYRPYWLALDNCLTGCIIGSMDAIYHCFQESTNCCFWASGPQKEKETLGDIQK